MQEFACKSGHTGRLCQLFEEGFYTIGGVFDLECGEWGRVTTTVAIIGVVFVWYGINRVASGNYDALDVALLYVQVTGAPPARAPTMRGGEGRRQAESEGGVGELQHCMDVNFWHCFDSTCSPLLPAPSAPLLFPLHSAPPPSLRFLLPSAPPHVLPLAIVGMIATFQLKWHSNLSQV